MKKDQIVQIPVHPGWLLEYFYVSSGTEQIPTAVVTLQNDRAGIKPFRDAAAGKADGGSIAALTQVINRVTRTDGILMSYNISSSGKCKKNRACLGVDFHDVKVVGEGLSFDIMEAIALAYLDAINRFLQQRREAKKKKRAST